MIYTSGLLVAALLNSRHLCFRSFFPVSSLVSIVSHISIERRGSDNSIQDKNQSSLVLEPSELYTHHGKSMYPFSVGVTRGKFRGVLQSCRVEECSRSRKLLPVEDLFVWRPNRFLRRTPGGGSVRLTTKQIPA
jgi:hypothetical protein